MCHLALLDCEFESLRVIEGEVSILHVRKPNIYFQEILVYHQGEVLSEKDLTKLRERMQEKIISIDIDLKSGQHTATAWGCDLTEQYVRINSEYLT